MDFRQSTAATVVVGPILDSTGAEYTSAVIGDLSISKNGGTLTAMAAAATLTHIANGQYTLVMTTGNLDTLGRFQITCNKSTYQMPERSGMVMPASVWDALYANATNAAGGLPTATGSISALAGAISTFAGGAVSSVTGNVGGNVAGSVGSVVGNVGGNVVGSVASVVGAVALDPAVGTQINNIENAAGWLLAINSGACANPQTSEEQYDITAFGIAFRVVMAGQTSTGIRTAPTLSKP